MKSLIFAKFLLYSCIIFIHFTDVIQAQEKPFGVGIILGEPTGISGEYRLDESNSINIGIAYSLFTNINKFSIHVDFVNHIFQFGEAKLEFPLYYGFGFRWRVKNGVEPGLGVRGVAGLKWISADFPIAGFLEISPVFELFPETKLGFDAGLGVRYYFN